MNRRSYCVVTGIILIVIALLHLLRINYQWRVVIGPLVGPGLDLCYLPSSPEMMVEKSRNLRDSWPQPA